MAYYISTTPRMRRMRMAHHGNGNSREFDFHLPVDVREEGDAFALRAVVPGLSAEDIDIQVLEDVITIAGEYKAEDADEGGDGYLLRELRTGKFHRSLRMPADLDASKADAEIKNGILTLRVPKAEHARPRQIKVSVN